MAKVKIAIAGVGNCASALIQGIHYYSKNKSQHEVIGLAQYNLAGMTPADIEVVAAFDVNETVMSPEVILYFLPEIRKKALHMET